jgi:hypothetical protein
MNSYRAERVSIMTQAMRKPPTSQQVLQEQQRLAEADAKRKAQAAGTLPVTAESKLPAVRDNERRTRRTWTR